jgi:hypothetical protein
MITKMHKTILAFKSEVSLHHFPVKGTLGLLAKMALQSLGLEMF